MNLEALKLELLHCLERAEEADRDEVRLPWPSQTFNGPSLEGRDLKAVTDGGKTV